MSINYEKIVSVFMKERGLCEGTLIERNDSRRRTVGCAIGSLLWNAGFKKLDTLDSHVCPSPEWDESKQECQKTTLNYLMHEGFLIKPLLICLEIGFKLRAYCPR